MTRFLDITGERFGSLVAISRSIKKVGGRVSWDCICDCGNSITVMSTSLRSGNTKSCGCRKVDGRMKGWLKRGLLSVVEVGSRKLYSKYKHSAKCRNISFSLSIEEFVSISSDPCHYCGVTAKSRYDLYTGPEKEVLKSGGLKVFCGNGVDRLDSDSGYTVYNCVPCCTKCNYMKASMSEEEFVDRVNTIHNHIAGRNFSLVSMCLDMECVDVFLGKAA